VYVEAVTVDYTIIVLATLAEPESNSMRGDIVGRRRKVRQPRQCIGFGQHQACYNAGGYATDDNQ
jgi:hypothetical protein